MENQVSSIFNSKINITKWLILSFVGLILIFLMKLFFSSYMSFNNSGIGGLKKESNLDYLIIGSSHVRFSYDISLIEKENDINAYALSYSYFSYPFVSRTLKFIDREMDVKIKTIIIDVYSLMFSLKKEFVDTQFILDSPYELKIDLLKYIYSNYSTLGFLDYYEILFTSKAPNLLTWPINRPLVDSRSYKGAYIKKNLPGLSLESFNSLKIGMKYFDFSKIRKDQINGIHEIIKWAQDNSKSVIFVETPLPQKVAALPELVDLKNKIKALFSSKNVTYLDTQYFKEFSHFNHQHFFDENHLSTLGRRDFSREIIDLVN
jgi:hypothetical protein